MMGGGEVASGGGANSELVAQIKNLQRNTPGFKEQWWAFCESEGGGVRDPAKHQDDFLETFLASYQSGEIAERTAATPGLAPTGELDWAKFIKEGQRKSENFKNAWKRYCAIAGGGVNDPAKHDGGFVVSFLDFLGQQAAMSGMGMGMMGGGMPPAKRARTAPQPSAGKGASAAWGGGWDGGWDGGMGGLSGGMVPLAMVEAMAANMGYGGGMGGMSGKGGGKGGKAQAAGGGGPKDKFVDRVKRFQRSSDENKQMWWAFCDSDHGGVRDPARHEVATLKTFCDGCGVPA